MLIDEPRIPVATDHAGYGRARLARYNLAPKDSYWRGLLFFAVTKFLRLCSVYWSYFYIISSDASVCRFAFVCMLGASVLLGALQRPWRGRRLAAEQWVSVVFNGLTLAVSSAIWFYSLKTAGPIRATLAEYSGAALASITSMLFGKSARTRSRKIRGLAVTALSLYLLSRSDVVSVILPPGFSLDDFSLTPGEIELLPKYLRGQNPGVVTMVAPVASGFLGALRRALVKKAAPPNTRSGKGVLQTAAARRRIHALSAVAATICLLPPAIYFSLVPGKAPDIRYHGSVVGTHLAMVVFGLVLNFYTEQYAEEKLHVNSSSVKHLAVSTASGVGLQLIYGQPLAVGPFLMCVGLLSAGLKMSTGGPRERSDVVSAGPLGPRTTSGQSLDSESGDESKAGRAWVVRRLGGLRRPFRAALATRQSQRIACALAACAGVAARDLVGGVSHHALGLVAASCHLLFSCLALGIALVASVVARARPDDTFTYGYGRAEVLAGFVSCMLLACMALAIVAEAATRLLMDAGGPVGPGALGGGTEAGAAGETEELTGAGWMGLVVNMAGLLMVWDFRGHRDLAEIDRVLAAGAGKGRAGVGADRGAVAGEESLRPAGVDYNSHAACLHLLAGAMTSAVAVAATSGWEGGGWVDPLGSLLVAAVLLYGCWPVLRGAGEALALGLPPDLHARLGRAVERVGDMEGVLHVDRPRFWLQSRGQLAGTLQVHVAKGSDTQRLLKQVRGLFAQLDAREVGVQVVVVGAHHGRESLPSNALGAGGGALAWDAGGGAEALSPGKLV